MHKVALEEAAQRLAELIEEAASGEQIFIERGDGATFKIVPITSQDTKERGRKMAEALAKMAEINAFAEVDDPAVWQRDIRQDRSLPGRHN